MTPIEVDLTAHIEADVIVYEQDNVPMSVQSVAAGDNEPVE